MKSQWCSIAQKSKVSSEIRGKILVQDSQIWVTPFQESCCQEIRAGDITFQKTGIGITNTRQDQNPAGKHGTLTLPAQHPGDTVLGNKFPRVWQFHPHSFADGAHASVLTDWSHFTLTEQMVPQSLSPLSLILQEDVLLLKAASVTKVFQSTK